MQTRAAYGKLCGCFLILALLAATYAHPEQLVETDWVAAHAADANVRIVDMRQSGYAAGHVPGAVYLSPVAIRDAEQPADVPADAGGVRGDDGEARHLATPPASSSTTSAAASTRRACGGS